MGTSSLPSKDRFKVLSSMAKTYLKCFTLRTNRNISTYINKVINVWIIIPRSSPKLNLSSGNMWAGSEAGPSQDPAPPPGLLLVFGIGVRGFINKINPLHGQ